MKQDRVDRTSVHRILLVDDHAKWRQGLRAWVNEHHDLVVVGEAVNGREAVELTPLLCPAIVLMDVRLPELGGVEATKRISRLQFPPLVIGLSVHPSPRMEQTMLQAGAAGFLCKADVDDRLYEIMVTLLDRQTGASRRSAFRPSQESLSTPDR